MCTCMLYAVCLVAEFSDGEDDDDELDEGDADDAADSDWGPSVDRRVRHDNMF